ncbi:MAG TPA: universal stress protein [Terriglobales bacterium]|nr:universal stress protein [Terriglobales bacterium]
MAQIERKIEHLLLVIDESPASLRAIEYTGDLLRRRQGFQFHLLHLLPPLPPELLEFGGSEDPRKEQALENELRRDQQQWIASARKSAQPSVEHAVGLLRKAGIAHRTILCEFSYPTEPRDAARTVLEHAQARKCHTVIVGHKAHSWFREIASADLAEHILRHASGSTVWVVQ